MPYRDKKRQREAVEKHNEETREVLRYARFLLGIPVDKRKKQNGKR